MYRIFCESLKNYMAGFTDDEARKAYRNRIAMPLVLLCDATRYSWEKESETNLYKQVSDLLFHLEQNAADYPAAKAFLWTLESRGMTGLSYGTVSREDLNEQVKLVVMLLKLMYWEAAV